LKTNFRENKKSVKNEDVSLNEQKDLTPEEFEKFIISSGAKGSFMVYRSPKKDDELGMDNL
jgi:hypothetical protein|tara:strand:- start:172 stop:354 length:183 start_codon:yes stop_codon:yes gene_type:complete